VVDPIATAPGSDTTHAGRVLFRRFSVDYGAQKVGREEQRHDRLSRAGIPARILFERKADQVEELKRLSEHKHVAPTVMDAIYGALETKRKRSNRSTRLSVNEISCSCCSISSQCSTRCAQTLGLRSCRAASWVTVIISWKIPLATR